MSKSKKRTLKPPKVQMKKMDFDKLMAQASSRIADLEELVDKTDAALEEFGGTKISKKAKAECALAAQIVKTTEAESALAAHKALVAAQIANSENEVTMARRQLESQKEQAEERAEELQQKLDVMKDKLRVECEELKKKHQIECDELRKKLIELENELLEERAGKEAQRKRANELACKLQQLSTSTSQQQRQQDGDLQFVGELGRGKWLPHSSDNKPPVQTEHEVITLDDNDETSPNGPSDQQQSNAPLCTVKAEK